MVWLPRYGFTGHTGSNFIIKDLPSVLILIITDQILNDSMCCSYKYNWCLCRFIGKLYIFLITLFEICIFWHEVYWIKFKPDWSNVKLGPGQVRMFHHFPLMSNYSIYQCISTYNVGVVIMITIVLIIGFVFIKLYTAQKEVFYRSNSETTNNIKSSFLYTHNIHLRKIKYIWFNLTWMVSCAWKRLSAFCYTFFRHIYCFS